MSDTLLQLTSIDKTFGGVVALREARLHVRAGEVLGLVGENGAGKSTLINIATGLFPADGGVMLLGGQQVAFANTRQAAEHGVMVVHQEADLFAQLSIAENMLLGRGLERGPAGLINWGATHAEARRMVAEMGEAFDVTQDAGGLTVARRTMAEIAAAVATNPRVLFLDEPTASLTVKEIENLFAQIRRLRDAGVGIVYVSHRLEEILEVCDRVTIMRDGATIETKPVSELTMDHIVATMVGRELETVHAKRAVPIGEVRAKFTGLTARDGSFRDITFDVRAGEIVGLYGFVGAGRSEFAQAVFGIRQAASGAIEIDGKPLRIRSPRHAVAQGLAYLPEDRLVQAVFREHALRTNASITLLPRLSAGTFVRRGRELDLADRVMREMNVRASSMEQPIGTLSGGNQQKVIFGRWAATNPNVLILDEPTRGVDVGAKAEIHKLICDLAEKGAAIILISSELPEVMAMSDRVITLSEGRVTGEFDPKKDGEKAIAAAAVPRSAEKPVAVQTPFRRGLARALQMRELGLIVFILLLGGYMTVTTPASFANPSNMLDILKNAAIPAIMAQGAMLIICAGGIDISVGSMMGLVGAIAALAVQAGVPAPVCLAIAMAAGVALSLLNGGMSLAARIHPIIVTLAGLSIYRGVMRIVTDGKEIMNLPAGYRALADGNWLGVPKICYYVIVISIAAHILLRYTLLGRQVLALGNSASAARLIGLSKTRLTLFVFACSGALVGLSAVLNAAYYGKVQANTGVGLELQAIAAAVIGGTNILGGRGSALGTLLGAILVSLLYNSLVLLEASAYWQNIFVGGLILLAVIVDALVQRLRGSAS
ncbi:MAG: ATP-binding cassette domain-containing protein [Candidatus Hydrogenedentes bacterium]|nr:ATP-binding cassette domain-containing protein [Candidatus Hydrogenedentota bacterium]